MGRRKVRHYNPREYYKELFDAYFREHADEVIEHAVREMGFDSLKAMRNQELTGMWFDCGFVYITPRNKEQYHEWYLDNDRISANLFMHNPCYNTQSSTLKEIMVHKALKDLGLENDFYVNTRLD